MSTDIVIQLLTQIEQHTAQIAELLSQMQQPAQSPNSPSESYRDFPAESVIMTTNDKGEPAYKIVGHPYRKHGVRVWPEVLPVLGINPDDLKPGPNPFYGQVRALMGVNGETGEPCPKKIVGLTPGDHPQS